MFSHYATRDPKCRSVVKKAKMKVEIEKQPCN